MRILLSTFSLMLFLAAITAWVDRIGALHAETDETTIILKPCPVTAKPVTSFGISLYYVADVQTRRIIRLFVLEVLPHSDAEAKGLKTGTEIIAADGNDIGLLDARFDPKSEFNHLFMNRRAGDRITLTIIRKKGAKPRTVELTEGSNGLNARRW